MFYDNFVRLSVRKGLSPSAAAEEMGFKRSVVSRWKAGAVPRQATLQRIADFFGANVRELVEDEMDVENVDEVRQALRERPDLRTLFTVATSVPASTIYKAIAMIEEFKEQQ